MQNVLLDQCKAVGAAVYATRMLLSQVEKTLFPDVTYDAEEESAITYQLFSKPEQSEVPLQDNEDGCDEVANASKENDVPLMVEPTEGEVAEDRQLRHKILLGLFQLACAMVGPTVLGVTVCINSLMCLVLTCP